MASNLRHLAGCEDGTGILCCERSRGASREIAERPNTGKAKRTDRSTIECEEILSFVSGMFPSLLEVIIGQELPVECSKLTCSAKEKKIGLVPGK